MRHAGPLPTSPDEDDLVALADAVRESRDGVMFGSGGSAAFGDYGELNNGAVLAPPPTHPAKVGRRRGHLRVLPDPPQ